MTGPPPHLGPLDLDWLRRALGRDGRLAPISSVAWEPIGVFSSELWRLRLAWAEPAAAHPESLVLKHPKASASGPRRDGFAEEIGFYERIADTLPLRIPRPLHADRAGPTGEPILLLEDVAGLEHVDWVGGASDAHAERAIAELARLHATYWGRTQDLDAFPDESSAPRRDRIAGDYDAVWREHGARLGDRFGPAMAALGDALAGRLGAALDPGDAPITLLHGDAHFENLPRARGGGDEDVVFLDWASVARGWPGFDVAVWIAMSYPPARRRAVESDVVAAHARHLRALGVTDFADPERDYRRGLVRRFALMVGLAAMLPDDALAQRGWSFATVCERCFVAAVDQRVADVL